MSYMTLRDQPPADLRPTATLKLASYQKPERRLETERRKDPRRAVAGERRTAGQRVLRALFGT